MTLNKIICNFFSKRRTVIKTFLLPFFFIRFQRKKSINSQSQKLFLQFSSISRDSKKLILEKKTFLRSQSQILVLQKLMSSKINDVKVVLVDYLLKTKKEQKNSKKHELQDNFIKTNQTKSVFSMTWLMHFLKIHLDELLLIKYYVVRQLILLNI